jgi:hypothetical protein
LRQIYLFVPQRIEFIEIGAAQYLALYLSKNYDDDEHFTVAGKEKEYHYNTSTYRGRRLCARIIALSPAE